MLTLDFLGILDNYSKQFDLNKYRRHRDEYIYEVFRDYRDDHYKSDLRDLIISTGYELPKAMVRQLANIERKRRIYRVKQLLMSVIRRFF